jgi:hypothetical protein
VVLDALELEADASSRVGRVEPADQRAVVSYLVLWHRWQEAELLEKPQQPGFHRALWHCSLRYAFVDDLPQYAGAIATTPREPMDHLSRRRVGE